MKRSSAVLNLAFSRPWDEARTYFAAVLTMNFKAVAVKSAVG